MGSSEKLTHDEVHYKIEVMYSDEAPNMTGLPEWNPPDPDENDSSVALLISFGLLLFTLILPTIFVLIASRFKSSFKRHTASKPMPEELSLLDHIYDPDGRYRESIFEGMLSEDAADDVEIPAKSRKDDGLSCDLARVEKMNSMPRIMKHTSTQTDELLAYSAAKIESQKNYASAFDSPLKRTMDESEQLCPIDKFLLKGTTDQLNNRTPRRSTPSPKRAKHDALRQRKRPPSGNRATSEHIGMNDDGNRLRGTPTKYKIARTQETASPDNSTLSRTSVTHTSLQNRKNNVSPDERANPHEA